MDPLAKYTLG